MNAASLLVVGSLLAADPPGMTLRGTVLDTQKRPVVGARVGIATAAPRVGQGLFCPSCYRDCAKSTTTNTHGHFEIRGLDPALKFTVLISEPGKKAQHTGFVDPFQDELKIVLQPLPANHSREHTVVAQVLNDGGHPIGGAFIDPFGVGTSSSGWWGPVQVDPTVSDEQGRFSLFLPPDYESIAVKITAAGYAGSSPTLKPGLKPQIIQVPTGTRVTGRLVHAGQPMAGLAVAVVQTERDAGHHFIKAVGAISDKNGKFVFDYLPATEQYAIFTPLEQGPQKFVLTTKLFKARGDHEERSLGDLQVIPCLHLAGRVEVPPGRRLPPSTKIALDRDPAWDMIEAPVDKDGHFIIDGLPPETYEVRIDAKGYEIDGTRMHYQVLEHGTFGLRLRVSTEDVRIPLVQTQPSSANRVDTAR